MGGGPGRANAAPQSRVGRTPPANADPDSRLPSGTAAAALPCPRASDRLEPVPLALRLHPGAARAPTGGGGDSCHRCRGATHAPPPPSPPRTRGHLPAPPLSRLRPQPRHSAGKPPAAKCACAAPRPAWLHRACAAAPWPEPGAVGSAPSWRCYPATGSPGNRGDNSVPACRGGGLWGWPDAAVRWSGPRARREERRGSRSEVGGFPASRALQ